MFPLHIGLDPVLVHLGPLALRWYGLLIGVGIAIGLWVDAREAERRGLGRDLVYRLASWLIVFGIIGGRLYYVVQNDFGYYLTHPQDLLATWQGGMAFYGAIFAGAATILVFAWREGRSGWTLLDTLVLGLPLGQAFGRLGNVVNGDIVGYPTSGWFAFVYTNPHAFIAPVLLGVPVFPAQVLELIASLLIFALLWRLRTRLVTPGMLSTVYVVSYSASQFLVFFWRANSVTLFGLKQAQLTALVVLAACVPLAVYLQRRSQAQRRSSEATMVAAEPAAEGPSPAPAR